MHSYRQVKRDALTHLSFGQEHKGDQTDPPASTTTQHGSCWDIPNKLEMQ